MGRHTFHRARPYRRYRCGRQRVYRRTGYCRTPGPPRRSSCSSDIIPTTPITPTQSQELEVIKKTISFDSQGGSSVISISVKVGDKATKPNAPEKVGYTFSGWYKESSCVNEWNFETETVLEDITLYAKWTVVDNPTPNPAPAPLKSFTIKFVTNCSDVVADETDNHVSDSEE